MKYFFPYLIALCCYSTLIGQCDSIQIESKLRNDTFGLLNIYGDQINYLSKSVIHFLSCEYFEEAIDWQWSKYYIANKEKRILDQQKYLNELEDLLKKLEGNISSNFKAKYSLKVLISWSDLNNSIGYKNRAIAQLESAERLYGKDFQKLSDESKKGIINTYKNLGFEYYFKNEYLVSIQYFEKAIQYAQFREKERDRLSMQTLNLGYLLYVYLKIGDQVNALKTCYEHLRVSKKLVKIDKVFNGHLLTSFRSLSEWYINNHSLDSALYYMNKSVVLEKINNSSSYESEILRAKILIANDELESSGLVLQNLIKINGGHLAFFEKNKMVRSLDMARLLIVSNDFITAVSLMDVIYSDLKEKMLHDKSKNLPIFNINERYYLDLLLSQLSIPEQNNIDSIINLSNSAFDIIEKGFSSITSKHDKLIFTQKSTELAEKLLDLLPVSQSEYHENAFSAIEKSKSATLFNSWKQKQLIDLVEDDGLFYEEQILGDKLEVLTSKFLAASDSLEMLLLEKEISLSYEKLEHCKNMLKVSNPTYYKMKYSWENSKIVDVQKILNSDEVLINYFEGNATLYAIVITNNKSRIIKINSLAEIKNMVERLSISIFIDRNTTLAYESNNDSYLLYNRLLGPLSDYLKERIIISPSGSLNRIPFSALFKNENRSIDDMLIAHHAVSYTPSASLFCQLRMMENNQIIRNALLVAPKFEKQQYNADLLAMRSALGELTFNIPEVEMASTFMNNKALINEEATKEAILKELKGVDLIHFATHAKSNNDDPSKSYVAFYSNDNSNDEENLLFLDDLSKLHLSAKLVVLSACETGLGKIFKGEGSMSLANACFYAGSQSVVATSWSVQDKASFDIMSSFYKYLDEGLPKDKALQSAQLDYLNSSSLAFRNPYYWAGFSVIGNTNPLQFSNGLEIKYWFIFTTLFIILFVGFILYKKNRSSI